MMRLAKTVVLAVCLLHASRFVSGGDVGVPKDLGNVAGAELSPDGKILVVFEEQSDLKDAKTQTREIKGSQMRAFETKTGRQKWLQRLPRCMAAGMPGVLKFSPDGKTMALALGPSDSVEMALEPNRELTPSDVAIMANSVGLFDVETGTLLHRFKTAMETTMGGMGFSPDSQLLALESPGFDPLSLAPGMPQNTPRDSEEKPYSLVLWRTSDGKKQQVFHPGDTFLCPALSPDGKLLASIGCHMQGTGRPGEMSGGDVFLRLWDLASGKSVAEVKVGPYAPGYKLLFSHDGKYLAGTLGDPGGVGGMGGFGGGRLGGGGAGQLPGQLPPGVNRMTKAIPNSKAAKTPAPMNDTAGALRVHVWEVPKLRAKGKSDPLNDAFDAGELVAFTSDSKAISYVAWVGKPTDAVQKLILWDWDAKKRGAVKGDVPPGSTFWTIANSPRGTTFATIGKDGLLRFFDTHTGKEQGQVKTEIPKDMFSNANVMPRLTFSGDGSTLLLVCPQATNQLMLWNAASVIKEKTKKDEKPDKS
jgi:WD40 repeat protein